jgi:hypothetical protein
VPSGRYSLLSGHATFLRSEDVLSGTIRGFGNPIYEYRRLLP